MAKLYFTRKTSFSLSVVQAVSIVLCCASYLMVQLPQALLLGLGLQHKTVEALEVRCVLLMGVGNDCWWCVMCTMIEGE